MPEAERVAEKNSEGSAEKKGISGAFGKIRRFSKNLKEKVSGGVSSFTSKTASFIDSHLLGGDTAQRIEREKNREAAEEEAYKEVRIKRMEKIKEEFKDKGKLATFEEKLKSKIIEEYIPLKIEEMSKEQSDEKKRNLLKTNKDIVKMYSEESDELYIEAKEKLGKEKIEEIELNFWNNLYSTDSKEAKAFKEKVREKRIAFLKNLGANITDSDILQMNSDSVKEDLEEEGILARMDVSHIDVEEEKKETKWFIKKDGIVDLDSFESDQHSLIYANDKEDAEDTHEEYFTLKDGTKIHKEFYALDDGRIIHLDKMETIEKKVAELVKERNDKNIITKKEFSSSSRGQGTKYGELTPSQKKYIDELYVKDQIAQKDYKLSYFEIKKRATDKTAPDETAKGWKEEIDEKYKLFAFLNSLPSYNGELTYEAFKGNETETENKLLEIAESEENYNISENSEILESLYKKKKAELLMHSTNNKVEIVRIDNRISLIDLTKKLALKMGNSDETRIDLSSSSYNSNKEARNAVVDVCWNGLYKKILKEVRVQEMFGSSDAYDTKGRNKEDKEDKYFHLDQSTFVAVLLKKIKKFMGFTFYLSRSYGVDIVTPAQGQVDSTEEAEEDVQEGPEIKAEFKQEREKKRPPKLKKQETNYEKGVKESLESAFGTQAGGYKAEQICKYIVWFEWVEKGGGIESFDKAYGYNNDSGVGNEIKEWLATPENAENLYKEYVEDNGAEKLRNVLTKATGNDNLVKDVISKLEQEYGIKKKEETNQDSDSID